MKRLVFLLLLSGCAMNKTSVEKTEWVGEMAIGYEGSYHHDVYWMPHIEVGLRSDGVVVWRRK